MYSSVAAIRAGRFPARYVRSTAHYREARLGLRRAQSTQPSRGAGAASHAALTRLRSARAIVPAPVSMVHRVPLRHATRVAWSQPPARARRRTPVTGAAPWRD